MDWAVLAIFVAVYVGMAVGGLPRLRVDRAWIAAAGATAIIALGVFSVERAAEAIDAGAIVMLFALMILSAQFAISGFYERCAAWVVDHGHRPALLLAGTVTIAGVLSAVLVNDIVAFALTPVLCAGVQVRNLDPRPFLLALACAANAGSAATLIGNPQNILIGQAGNLDFWSFVAVSAVPAIAALAITFVMIWLLWRNHWHSAPAIAHAADSGLRAPTTSPAAVSLPAMRKALAATAILLALFATPLPREASVLIVAMGLMMSARIESRELVERVDWNLLLLFAGLFVVTEAFAHAGWSSAVATSMQAAGFASSEAVPLAFASLAGSNLIGNVPFVMLLLEIEPAMPVGTLYALAMFSTLAGNFLLVGSVVNLIVAERARASGVTLSFLDFAKTGIPLTLASMAIAVAWMLAMGWVK